MEGQKFISKKAFAGEVGLKIKTITNWQYRYWLKGFHYTVVGCTTMIHRERVEAWLGNKFDYKLPKQKVTAT